MKYLDGKKLYFRDNFGAISGDLRESGISLDEIDVKRINDAIKPLGLGAFILTETEITDADRKYTLAVESSIRVQKLKKDGLFKRNKRVR